MMSVYRVVVVSILRNQLVLGIASLVRRLDESPCHVHVWCVIYMCVERFMHDAKDRSILDIYLSSPDHNKCKKLAARIGLADITGLCHRLQVCGGFCGRTRERWVHDHRREKKKRTLRVSECRLTFCFACLSSLLAAAGGRGGDVVQRGREDTCGRPSDEKTERS